MNDELKGSGDGVKKVLSWHLYSEMDDDHEEIQLQ
jgi:hypothetical protein